MSVVVVVEQQQQQRTHVKGLEKTSPQQGDLKENMVNSVLLQNHVPTPPTTTTSAQRKPLAVRQARPQSTVVVVAPPPPPAPAASGTGVVRYSTEEMLGMRAGASKLRGMKKLKAIIKESGAPCKGVGTLSTTAAKKEAGKRASGRQRQIEYGMNTEGYKRFTQFVLPHLRRPGDPVPPSVMQACSKRSFDGQARKWRRLLHLYDSASSLDDCLAIRDAILAASEEKHLLRLAQQAAAGTTNKDSAAAAAVAAAVNGDDDDDDDVPESEPEQQQQQP